MSKKRNQRNTKESLKNLSAKRKTYRGGGRAGGEPALPQSVAERRAKAAAARAKTAANKAPTKTKPKAPAPFDDSIAPKPKPKVAPKPKAPVPRSSITDMGTTASTPGRREPNPYLDEEPRQTVYNENAISGADFSNLTPTQIAEIGKDVQVQGTGIVPDFTVNTSGVGRDRWWEGEGYDTAQDAIADGWTFNVQSGTWTKSRNNNNNNGGDTDSNYDTGPLNVENKRPEDVELDQMEATKIKGLSPKLEASYKKELADPNLSEDRRRIVTIALEAAGRSANIQQLDQAGTVTSAGVSAPTMAPAAQGTVTTGELPPDVVANTYDAVMAGELDETEAAQMLGLSPEAIANAEGATLTERAQAANRDRQQEQEAIQKAPAAFDRDLDSVIQDVSFREPVDVERTKGAEAAEREAIIGSKATERDSARIIETVGFEAAQRRTVTGTAAKSSAGKMLEVVGELTTRNYSSYCR